MAWEFNKVHILERIGERFKAVDAETEFERIKDILTKNIPDDWRLTRFSPDFLIRDVKTGITLVGHQEGKMNSVKIIKHVNSALFESSFAKAKIGKNIGSQVVYDIARRPNLFIGDKDTNDIFKKSSVLARQYEKVSFINLKIDYQKGNRIYYCHAKAKAPIEYFRLHPLTLAGLDQHAFAWIEWNAADGTCEFIDGNPPKDFHGEDYWSLQVKSHWDVKHKTSRR